MYQIFESKFLKIPDFFKQKTIYYLKLLLLAKPKLSVKPNVFSFLSHYLREIYILWKKPFFELPAALLHDLK